MNYALKKNLFTLLQGAGMFSLASRFTGSQGFILMFHRIRTENTPSVDTSFFHNLGLSITRAYLEKIIADVTSGNTYTFIPIQDIHNALRSNKKFIVLTFDDGYNDNYSIAYPLLKQKNIPFTVYISNVFPEKQAILWWYLLSELITENEHLTFDFHHTRYAYPTARPEEKASAYAALEEMIKKNIPHNQEELFDALFVQNGLDLYTYSDSETMSWKQIQTLARDPLVTIGAHTRSHCPLANMGKKELHEEIGRAKQELEQKTGTAVEHFSFPYGKQNDISPEAFAEVIRAGFKTAVTTHEANIYATDRHRLLCLPRFTMSGKFEHPGFLDLYGSGIYAPLLRLEKKLTGKHVL